MNNYGIYAIGAALVDTEIQVDDHDLKAMGIDKGLMTLVDSNRLQELIEQMPDKLAVSKLACGGSAANSAIAAQYFGTSTYFSCQVANDEQGTFYANDLLRAGVATQALKDARDGITGKCLVLITPDAERTMNTHLGISESLSVDNIDTQALAASRFAYIEGYLVTSQTGKPAAIRVREEAQKHNVKVAVSLSDPGIVEYFREGLQEIIGDGIDLIFCNEAEALAFSQSTKLEDAIDALKRVSKCFVITRGSEPTLVFDGNEVLSVAAQNVKAIDTNGAGDMFAGAFLAAHQQGHSFTQAAEFANKAAAQVVSQYGPRLQPEQYEALKALL